MIVTLTKSLTQRCPFVALACAVLLVLVLLVATPARGESLTHLALSSRIALTNPPNWTVSGAWTSDGDRLVLVDALASELRVYNPDGSLAREPLTKLPDIEVFTPSYIQNVGGRFLLEYDTAQFAWLTEDFEVLSTFSLKNVPTEAGVIVSTFQWTALNETTLLTLSDVRESDGSWSSKFLRITLHPTISATALTREISIQDPSRPLYLLGQPFLAALSPTTGAFLRLPSMDQNAPLMGLVQLQTEPPVVYGVLAETIRDASVLPVLPTDNRAYRYEDIYGVFDTVDSFVAGIYGWEGRLFLLIRHAPRWRGNQSLPIWWLREVLLGGEAAGSYQEMPLLPVRAEHLTVVPGPVAWAIIEKGPVTGVATQDIKGLRLISSDSLR